MQPCCGGWGGLYNHFWEKKLPKNGIYHYHAKSEPSSSKHWQNIPTPHTPPPPQSRNTDTVRRGEGESGHRARARRDTETKCLSWLEPSIPIHHHCPNPPHLTVVNLDLVTNRENSKLIKNSFSWGKLDAFREYNFWPRKRPFFPFLSCKNTSQFGFLSMVLVEKEENVFL